MFFQKLQTVSIHIVEQSTNFLIANANQKVSNCQSINQRWIYMKKVLLLFLVCFLSLNASAGVILTGQILSKETKKPIGQAVIELPAHGLWAVANNQGQFTIQNAPQGKTQIAVSCLGYVTMMEEVDINPKTKSLTCIFQ